MPVYRWKNKKKRLLNFEETSIVRKLMVYHAAWNEDLHVSRWGFQQFRVLFVTPVRRRISEMFEAVDFVTNDNGPPHILFFGRCGPSCPCPARRGAPCAR